MEMKNEKNTKRDIHYEIYRCLLKMPEPEREILLKRLCIIDEDGNIQS